MRTKTAATPETPQSLLRALRADCGTWQWTAIRLEELTGKRFDRALLNRVARGKQSAPNSLLLALGLPVTAPAPVCPVHGVVHTAKRCPKAAPQWDYGEWRRDNLGRLLAIVTWAQWPAPARGKWPKGALR